ncbi:hypothetical protein PR003_g25009, partial [Phytophthora rubi]
MFKRTLLLLVALSLVVRIDATGITMPAVEVPALGGKFDKRSLRGFMTNDETATEERGPADAVKKVKTVLSTSKLGQKLAAFKQARVAKREVFVKKLLDDGADFETLWKKKGLRVEVPDSIYQVGNLGPHAGNKVPQAARAAGEGAVSAGVGNQVPREVTQTITDEEGAAGASDVGNIVPQEVTQTITDAGVAEGTPGVGNQVPHGEVGNIVPPRKAGNIVPHGIKKISGAAKVVPRGEDTRGSRRKPGLVAWPTTPVASDSEPPTKAPAAEECYHIFDGVTGRRIKAGAVELTALPEVSELLNLEELAMEDFLAELKAGEIAELVLL